MTPAMIVVSAYCTQPGDPCRAVVPPGQLAQAVADYIAENPLPLCPEGTTASIVSVLTLGEPVTAVICAVD